MQDGLTYDAFLGRLVTLVQPRKGHRAGLDAALLQALVPATMTGCVVELGAGVGSVAFSVAARARAVSVVGVEREAELVACGEAALARPENAGFADRVRLVVADAGDVVTVREHAGGAEKPVHWVLMNPPFDVEGKGSSSPDALRRAAHAGAAGLLATWTATAASLLQPGGRLGLIHRAEALPQVLAALGPAFGDIHILPVHPTMEAPAGRILVTARRGRRTPLTLAPALILHLAGGGWTPEVDVLLRGQAELAF